MVEGVGRCSLPRRYRRHFMEASRRMGASIGLVVRFCFLSLPLLLSMLTLSSCSQLYLLSRTLITSRRLISTTCRTSLPLPPPARSPYPPSSHLPPIL